MEAVRDLGRKFAAGGPSSTQFWVMVEEELMHEFYVFFLGGLWELYSHLHLQMIDYDSMIVNHCITRSFNPIILSSECMSPFAATTS